MPLPISEKKSWADIMQDKKIQAVNKQIKSVTYISVFINICLCLAKFLIGYFGGSLALIADGIHSISDAATDFAVLLGVRLGAKKPDECHPYGHGRAETFSAVFIALVLILVGGTMIYHAAADIAKGNVSVAHMPVFIVALISVIVKELLYKITRKVAVKSHSSALYANAWHHRSDALSSIAVLVGLASLKFGFNYGDQIAAIAVGLMVILVGVKVVGDCMRELTESAVDSDTIEQIKAVIACDSSIRQWHKLRTRTVGREVFLDLHILVNPDLNVAAAHEIAENLENAMHTQIARPVNITIHIEPDLPELRK